MSGAWPELVIWQRASDVAAVADRLARKADPDNRVDFRTPTEREQIIAGLMSETRKAIRALEQAMAIVEEDAATQAQRREEGRS